MEIISSSMLERPLAENNWVLAVLALLPALILCVYLYIKDRVEKEPLGLLLGLLVFGAVSAFPAGWIEGILDDIITAMFGAIATEQVVGGETYLVLPTSLYTVYQAVSAFIGVALVEEFGKWLVLNVLTRKNRHFNSLFDGVIYGVFASLGFAAIENVLYAFSYGMETVLMRAVTSVPGHMFFGVLMGMYYSFWKVSERARGIERQLAAQGKLTVRNPINATAGKWLSLIVPVLVHGFYDFCLFVGTTFLIVMFYISLVAMYVYCFSRIRRFSKADGGIDAYAMMYITKKYRRESLGRSVAQEDQVMSISEIVEDVADHS